MTQTNNWHLHFDSYNVAHCQFGSARNGSVELPGGEDNFGYYQTINSLHRCTSGDNATTQWWFGEQKILPSKGTDVIHPVETHISLFKYTTVRVHFFNTRVSAKAFLVPKKSNKPPTQIFHKKRDCA